MTRARLLALLATAPVLAPGSPARAEAAGVRVGTAPTESYAVPFYGVSAGFYGKAGLNVDVSVFSSGEHVTTALAGGALDAGMADAIQVVLAVGRGIPFAIFAGGAQYVSDSSTSRLCVAKAGTIRVAKDLEGQTVSVGGLRSIQELATREWLQQNGADPENVKFVEIPSSAAVAALARGSTAAAIVTEPSLSAAGDDVRYLGNAYGAIAKRFYLNSWIANRDWLAKNADVARRLVQSSYDAARWANAHHDDTIPILAQYTKLAPERIHAMVRTTYGTSLDPGLIQPVVDVAYKYKLIDKHVNAADLIARV